VLGACQVQADDHIITPKAASIVRHMGPSFVSGWTREGITRTRRRCRLPLSHTLILESGRLCRGDSQKRGGRCRRSFALRIGQTLSTIIPFEQSWMDELSPRRITSFCRVSEP